ncbi:S-adenosyl-L-methionine-dependent methyltransferase [Macrolepiota fuliginosa MF-IS2]|uniref:S-adenosyl-L-methionine-dependent methyltransferase n=1 Tax=Macrolepiota fuliginosa MF-IS2 TaxID=1400762 RepID=A0A9P5X710_9AGAR|nr:S-adenosyl-L-methionine-dependent methyltransferase [Macrolepiota fuliginosa MF-IS2]
MTVEHSVERYFTNDSAYILPSDDQERKRLLKQHQALTHAFGNSPILAPVQFADGDQVLEIGAAAGAWLYDAAQQIGSSSKVKFHAIDIEDQLFPSEPPHNMSFSVASVLDLPPTWKERFSYVHQRLLMGALTETQWPTAVQEIYRVVRPGGWVELSEGEAQIGCPDGGERHQFHRLLHEFWVSRSLVVYTGLELPKLLKAVGFVDIKMVTREIPLGSQAGELGEAVLDTICGVLRAIKKPVLMGGGFGIVQTAEEYDALIDGFERAVNDTPGYSWKHYITYARKPEGVDD